VTVERALSLLFVPGSRPDRFDKAAASGADVVVLDLEDAVGAEDKDDARVAVAAWLGTGTGVVRVNAAGSPFHGDDLATLAGLPGLHAVMLPKAERANDVASVASRAGVPVIPLVETAVGVRELHELAAVPAVARLAIGTIDLAADLGCEDDWEPLLLARSKLVLASRAAGLAAPVDGVHVDFADDKGLLATTRRARSLGYAGRLCLHPRQIPFVHEAFALTEDEVAWARSVLSVEDAVGSVDGLMVDEPVRKRARAVLARLNPPEVP
jgi:citrate lyase subunit beta/citryl-CoA lyase